MTDRIITTVAAVAVATIAAHGLLVVSRLTDGGGTFAAMRESGRCERSLAPEWAAPDWERWECGAAGGFLWRNPSPEPVYHFRVNLAQRPLLGYVQGGRFFLCDGEPAEAWIAEHGLVPTDDRCGDGR